MQRASFSEMPCAIARTLDVIGDPWTPLILRDVALGITRFEAIQRNLGVSRKVLTQRLQALVEHEVVERVAYQDHPPRHDYVLTQKGRDLALVLAAIQSFGNTWFFAEEGPPLVWRHLSCGQISSPTLCCDACGQPVTADDAIPLRGPSYDAALYPELDKVLDAVDALAEAAE